MSNAAPDVVACGLLANKILTPFTSSMYLLIEKKVLFKLSN